MKLQSLMMAVALACAGTAFAQNASTAPQAPTYGSASASASADMGKTDKAVKPHRKLAKKAHASKHATAKHRARHYASAKHHVRHYASAKHPVRHYASAKRHELQASARLHERHEMHASARHASNTRMMGAGPSVDLNSSARQSRMDAAYNDWLRATRR